MDGDGDLDLVHGAGHHQPNQVYLNNGKGDFSDSGQELGNSNTRFVVLGDVDGDGDLDIVAGNDDGGEDRVYRNDGTGTFTELEAAFRPVPIPGFHFIPGSAKPGQEGPSPQSPSWTERMTDSIRNWWRGD